MTKTKTASKILGTSIVAFAVFALMAPTNMAHASLIGDDVTIELVNGDVANDPDGVSATKTKTVTNGLGAEFIWQDGGCQPPDEDITIDIEANTISVFVADNVGLFCVFNGNGEIIDAPLTFNISSLDWVGQPLGEVVGISVSSNSVGLGTTQNVIDGHSVQITIFAKDQLSESSATIVFELEKNVVVPTDIKPGSDPNSINTKSMGVVPVAILGSEDFDVTTIDVTTLAFGPSGAAPAHDLTDSDTYNDHIQDVNDDGFDDLVSHYKQKETGIACGDTAAQITGALNDGTPLIGEDSVNPICKP